MEPQLLQQIGLGLDAVGVSLVYFFGVSKGARARGFLVIEGGSPEMKRKEKLHSFLSFSGLLLILLGFGLQIVGLL